MLTNKKVTVVKYQQSTFNQNYTSVNEAAQNTKKTCLWKSAEQMY
jgi:hypothetical protein